MEAIIKELQTAYDNKQITMGQILNCFTSSVGKQLTEKGLTIEEKAEFFKSEEYNDLLNEYKSNFVF